MFTIYIIHTAQLGKFYIGFTGDNIETRISKHLSNHKGFTAKAKDWQLVYKEVFASKDEAKDREKQIVIR